jgi:cation transport ATPase
VTPARAGLLLAALMVLGRTPLEARMPVHMLVQLPGLLMAGALLVLPPTSQVVTRVMTRVMPAPWAALLFATGVVTTWMIPRALDAAVQSPIVDAIKMLSLVGTGAAGAWAWNRCSTLVRTFALGNSAWMMVTVGMLYLDAPQRLCTTYARSDQQQTGVGLVVLTVVGGALAIWVLVRSDAARTAALNASAMRPTGAPAAEAPRTGQSPRS